MRKILHGVANLCLSSIVETLEGNCHQCALPWSPSSVGSVSSVWIDNYSSRVCGFSLVLCNVVVFHAVILRRAEDLLAGVVVQECRVRTPPGYCMLHNNVDTSNSQKTNTIHVSSSTSFKHIGHTRRGANVPCTTCAICLQKERGNHSSG